MSKSKVARPKEARASGRVTSIVSALRPGTGAHRKHLTNMVERVCSGEAAAIAALIVTMAGREHRGEDKISHVAKRTIGPRVVLMNTPDKGVAMCGPTSPTDEALVIVPASYSETEHRFGLAWALGAYVAPAHHEVVFQDTIAVELIALLYGVRTTKRWIAECNPERTRPLPLPVASRRLNARRTEQLS